MKELIKQLAVEQQELKKARKTGPYKVTWSTWDHYHVPDNIKAAWKAAGQVKYNKIKITAAHNLRHEMKGSSYRHGYDPSYSFLYDREYAALKETIYQD